MTALGRPVLYRIGRWGSYRWDIVRAGDDSCNNAVYRAHRARLNRPTRSLEVLINAWRQGGESCLEEKARSAEESGKAEAEKRLLEWSAATVGWNSAISRFGLACEAHGLRGGY